MEASGKLKIQSSSTLLLTLLTLGHERGLIRPSEKPLRVALMDIKF